MNIRGYKCPHCKYAAKNKSGLDNHVNAIHLKLKKYKCPHCDYSAVQSGQIQVTLSMQVACMLFGKVNPFNESFRPT